MSNFTWNEKDLGGVLESYNDIYFQDANDKIENHAFSHRFKKHMDKLIRQSDYSPFTFKILVKLIPTYRRVAVALAVVIVCVFAGMPIMAANVPIIYNLMYLVSPATAQFFMPIQMSSESNGVRMEVVSTYIHDNIAEIYITLQDLTGNRVDATTDLFDSYSINRPFDSSAFCQRVGFDEETKTATFLIHITEWGEHNIEGDKITFSLRSFISDKKAFRDMPTDIPLDNLADNAPAKDVGFIGGGGDFDFWANDTATVLDVTGNLLTPVDGIDVTGIGYIDGKFHVQVSFVKDMRSDNHGFVFLKDENGITVESDYAIAFGDTFSSDKTEGIQHYNYVFSVPKSEISNFRLYGSFFTSGNFTEGNWRVTFPLVGGGE